MTGKQTRIVLALTFALFAVLALIATSGCSNEVRVQFKSCQEAREAGAPLPLHQGDVGWNTKLDPDGNGVAC